MSRRGRPGITVRMDPQMIESLKALAASQCCTLSALVTAALQALLDAESQK